MGQLDNGNGSDMIRTPVTGTAPDPTSSAHLISALHAAMAADRAAVPTDSATGRTATITGTGMETVAAVLWSRFLRFDVADPRWPDRDRFVLSSGRFLPLLRSLLHLTGHAPVPPGPAFGRHPAIETAAGPPGQGFATGVGMAMAERSLAGRFGRTLVDHCTWVLACETDLAAGVSLEAASLAGQMRLDKLVVLFEARPGGETGRTDGGADATTRFAASGWAVRRVDATDPDAIAAAIAGALRVRRPTLIACHSTRTPPPAPSLPDDAAIEAWRSCGQRGAAVRRGWLRRLARHRHRAEFERTLANRLPSGWEQAWRQGLETRPATATLNAARHGLELLCGLLPEMTILHSSAGSPILLGVPDTDAGAPSPDQSVRHLYCGVQEHAMAALSNGLSLHGSARPVLAAAFVSIDRMRPALRLAALMGQPVIYLLTGDGVALDEDGAGWQPVEQLASLRAMPEVSVFRPADPTEVAACWELVLRHDGGPSLIALSEGVLAGDGGEPGGLGEPDRRRRGCAQGGYLLAGSQKPRDVTLIATGAELAVAMQARAQLERQGIAVAVVSLPCWELFSAQPASYRALILGDAPRIGIEAASGFGWERWLGTDGVFIGMDGFGGAASADLPYRQFGITPEAVVARVRRRLGLAPH